MIPLVLAYLCHNSNNPTRVSSYRPIENLLNLGGFSWPMKEVKIRGQGTAAANIKRTIVNDAFVLVTQVQKV